MKTNLLAVLATGICAFATSGYAAEPALAGLRTALEKYLGEHGNLCLGKYDWPIDVSERDSRLGTRDALQMPVLERMGIVSSATAQKREEGSEQPGAVTRYDLTEAGRKFYVSQDTTTTTADGKTIVHHADFCAAKLRLDRIVGWNSPQTTGGDRQAMVAYTYRIATADWARKPEVQKVFPMVATIINGEGTLKLEQQFRLTKDGWVAIAP